MRCCNEKLFHDQSVFLTLTWDDEKCRALDVPSPVSLDDRPFQLFMKRTRKARPGLRLSYFMCGEYGDVKQRPHYHAIVFGLGFTDQVLFKTDPFNLFRSKELERLWPFGNSLIGEVTKETAQYVAGYLVAKDDREDSPRYERMNVKTGEVFSVAREFARMSLKPAIGLRFLEKFTGDVSVRDASVINGKEFRPPKYYDRKMKGYMKYSPDHSEYFPSMPLDAARFASNAEARAERGLSLKADSTPARLRVQEAVVRSRLALKRRLLED